MYTGGGIIEHTLVRAADLNSVADITGARWAPGFVPMYVVGIVALITNDIAATGVIKFDHRITFGSDTGRTDGTVGVLNLTTAHTGGKAVYKLITPFKVLPGQEVVAEVTDATGASDTADIILLLSPSPEVAANITAMVAST